MGQKPEQVPIQSKEAPAQEKANITKTESANNTIKSNETTEAFSTKVPELKWDHTPQQIEQACNDLLKESDERIKAISDVKEKRTFENTMVPLSKYEHWSTSISNAMGFYSSVSTVKEVRDASKKFDERTSAYNNELWLREGLYKAISSYKDEAVKDGSFAKLDQESQRYVNKILTEMETGGMKLDARKRYDLL